MTRLLWIPKSWKEFREHPETVYRTSNRLRAYNHHEILRNYPNIDSDVLGMTVDDLEFDRYDILIFQKHLCKTARVQKFRKKGNRLAVLDLCDPINREEALQINHTVDLVICSSHELEGHLKHNGLVVPCVTVIDSHEADASFIKRHVVRENPLVTWYGVGANYFKFIKQLQPALLNGHCDFRWAAEENPLWSEEPGFQNAVVWQLSIVDAWKNRNSWQRFIQQSDVGIVPVFDAVKSAHKVLNYMAYGIPVICSPIDSHKRIVVHGKTGFFASTPKEWEAYIKMLADPELRQKIGQNARNSVLLSHSHETVARTYADALHSALENKASDCRHNSILKKIRTTIFGN